MADFPALQGAGLYTPDEVAVQGHFAKVMDELMGRDFELLMSKAFGLDLSKYPKVYTIRGFTRAKDGNIHTDSTSKIVTVLVYFNENPWPHPDGRLRLLKSGGDLNDIIQEVPPQLRHADRIQAHRYQLAWPSAFRGRSQSHTAQLGHIRMGD